MDFVHALKVQKVCVVIIFFEKISFLFEIDLF